MVNKFLLLGKEFIGFVKLLRDCMIEKDHLHGADLKSCTQNDIDYLSDIFVFDCVRFYDAKSAIFTVSFGLNIIIYTLTTA